VRASVLRRTWQIDIERALLFPAYVGGMNMILAGFQLTAWRASTWTCVHRA